MRFSSVDLIIFLNLTVPLSDDDFFCFFIAFTEIPIRYSDWNNMKGKKLRI